MIFFNQVSIYGNSLFFSIHRFTHKNMHICIFKNMHVCIFAHTKMYACVHVSIYVYIHILDGMTLQRQFPVRLLSIQISSSFRIKYVDNFFSYRNTYTMFM